MPQRIYHFFQQSVEAKMQVGEELAPAIEEAGNRLVECLLRENKLLICGNGASSAIAQIFTSCLLDRFEKERPGLPAVWLGGNIATYTAIASENGFSDTFAKPVRALGQTHDVLVVVSTSGNPGNLIRAVNAAHDREMQILAITGRDGGEISSVLDENDMEICVSLNSRSRIHEIHLLIVFCLCDLIDHKLFGIE